MERRNVNPFNEGDTVKLVSSGSWGCIRGGHSLSIVYEADTMALVLGVYDSELTVEFQDGARARCCPYRYFSLVTSAADKNKDMPQDAKVWAVRRS